MSFSAEMKDFIGAWEKGNKILGAKTDEEYKKAQTEAVKKKTETEYDPERLKLQDEQARANLAKTQAGTGLIGQQIKNAGVSRGYTAALTDRLRNADAAIGGYQSGNLPVQGGIGPAVGGGTVAPSVNLQPRTDLLEYEDGGAIPDTAEEDDSVGPGAIPDIPAPAQPMTDISARSRGPAAGLPPGQQGYQGVISPQLVGDAVRGGYKYGTRELRRGTGARTKEAAMRLAQGQDALTPDEMEMARRAVDPDGRLTDAQRNMAALGSVYQHWANKGDPGRADKVAFQMLQHFRLASQRYAAIAAAAAEKGNMDMATKAALKAYANVPDGRDMQVTMTQDGKMQYNYTDENGKTISKGIATPEQFAAAAMGMTKGGFDQMLLSSAAAREGGRGTGGGVSARGTGEPKGDKVSDQKSRNEMLEPELQSMQEKWQKKNEGKEVDANYWGDLKDSATHIMQQNPNATPREAISAVQAYTDPKRKDDFKVTSEGGKNTIKFNDGNKIVLDDDTFDVLVNKKLMARKAAMAAEDQAKADKANEGKTWRDVKEGYQDFDRGAQRVVNDAGRAVGAMGEAAAGVASRAVPDAVRQGYNRFDEAAQGVANSVADRFRNKGAIPETSDSPL